MPVRKRRRVARCPHRPPASARTKGHPPGLRRATLHRHGRLRHNIALHWSLSAKRTTAKLELYGFNWEVLPDSTAVSKQSFFRTELEKTPGAPHRTAHCIAPLTTRSFFSFIITSSSYWYLAFQQMRCKKLQRYYNFKPILLHTSSVDAN